MKENHRKKEFRESIVYTRSCFLSQNCL